MCWAFIYLFIRYYKRVSFLILSLKWKCEYEIFSFRRLYSTIPTEDNRIFVTNSASGGYFHHRWRMNFGPPTSIFDKKSAIQIMYGILPKKSQFFSSIFIPLLLVISLLIETWDHSLHIWVENGLRNILDFCNFFYTVDY